MKKKKFIALMMTAAMVMGLAACGNKAEEPSAGADQPANT